eukprot:s6040_g6.t1
MARWLTAEFAVWYLVIAWAFLVKLPFAAAELAAICAEDARCSLFLHKTRLWPQQQIDLSDIQWQESYLLLELHHVGLCCPSACRREFRKAKGRIRTPQLLQLALFAVPAVVDHGRWTARGRSSHFGQKEAAKGCASLCP